ncbi:SHOCT domain-containing protein [bacterium]|nr:SHOCT domain-containing protein [bacterium]
MSSHKDSKLASASIDKTAQACRFSFKEMQLLVKKDNGVAFIANEKMRFGFANPAKLEVELQSSGNETRINVKASNLGIGPIQGGHVKGVLETFLSNVRLKINSDQQQALTGSDLASQLQKLAEMKAQGLLSDEEFSAAKAKLL